MRVVRLRVHQVQGQRHGDSGRADLQHELPNPGRT